MLFKRREDPGYWERFKVWLWPRTSWRRSGLYFLKRILRLSGAPYGIAMGAAVGAGVAITPFLGLHLVITFALAWLLRGNMIAGAIAGTCIGNPLTYAFIWASTYQLGHLILDSSARPAPARLEHDLLYKSWNQLWPILEPMTVGALPVGLMLGAVVYLVVYKSVSAYREARSQRFAVRRRPVSSPAE
jgi:uncharacterized protein (DUF2062 family)